MLRPRLPLPLLIALSLTGTMATGQVVINEVLYDAEPDTARHEFVEILNAGNTTVNLSGWRFSSGIEFTFSQGTELTSGSFLVVAEDPTALQAAFGGAPLGPYTGGLSAGGDDLVLRNEADQIVDRVTYQRGFPWPTCPDGQSMELISPTLDNDLGGSWRSSGAPLQAATVFLPENSTQWHYRKGDSEASTPASAWRETTFTEDGTWSVGQASIGYGDSDDNTEITDMRNNYWSLYFRHQLVFPINTLPSQLLLRMYIDDGCIVWINGQELNRFHVGNGDKDHDDSANNHDAEWEDFLITNPSTFFQEGVTNIVAVHGLQSSLSSSDFSMDMEILSVVSSGTTPSPEAASRVSAPNAPPQARQVRHDPLSPRAGDPVRISAKVSDPNGVQSVTLQRVTLTPGNYVRLTDSAYETGWTALPMLDDGTGGDDAAGDETYTVTLPGNEQLHRHLTRYRIVVEDAGGLVATLPYSDDPQPNFAFFTYDGVPAWTGADDPGNTADITYSSMVMTNTLPVYHLLSQVSDIEACQYNSGSRNTRFYGTMVYDGEVYDHIQYKIRGEASTYVSGKNKWRFYFELGHHFNARDPYGKRYPTPFRRMNFNGCSSPWVPGNRGMAGLDEAVSGRLYDLAGALTPRAHPVHLRIIDNAQEAPSSQYDGDLWGLYMSVEHIDGKFLDNHDLPDGSTYKIQGGNGDKRHQGEDQSTNTSDWTTFRGPAQSGSTAESWWRTNFDLPSYYAFRTINRAVSNVDLREHTNYGMYHHPDGHWRVIPQDLDMMFIAETHWPGHTYMENLLNRPALDIEFRNAARNLQDLLFSDSSPGGGQATQVVAEYSQWVNPPGAADTFADVDHFMWNDHPRTSSSHRNKFYTPVINDSRRGGTWTRTLPSADHEGFQQFITDFFTDTDPNGFSVGDGDQRGYGFNYVEQEASDNAIPDTPTLQYDGPAGFPVDALTFTSSAFGDPQGNGSFAAMRWRIAEIRNPSSPDFSEGDRWRFEVEPVWESDPLASFTAQHTLPANGLRAGATYRTRVQHKDDTGRWSHWSSPVEFVAGTPSSAEALQDLVVTEFHYHPIDLDETEFLELYNRGATTLDLEGVTLSGAINFTFSSGTTLAPDSYLVVVENSTEFSDRYQNPASAYFYSGIIVAGQWSGGLNNAGEALTLNAPGELPLYTVTYDDSNPWPERADGAGSSAELITASSLPTNALARVTWINDGDHWRSSCLVHGSPGREGSCLDDLQISELLAHSDAAPGLDWIEIENTGTTFVAFTDLYLADSFTNLNQTALGSITNGIGPGQRIVFSETQLGFAFSELGEEAVLTRRLNSQSIEFLDSVDFGASEQNVSFGLHLRSDGETDFTAQRRTTPSVANGYPLVGPAVISEMMVEPANGIEFLELTNLANLPLPLFDPLHPTNTWRLTSAVDFDLPAGVTLPACGTLILCNTNETAFRASYAIPAHVPVLGPWSGALNNAGESVKLRKPGAPEPDGFVPYILVDRVDYRPDAPWPLTSTGHSLERATLFAYANDPINWLPSTFAGGTPGTAPEEKQHLILDAPVETLTEGRIEWNGIPGQVYQVEFCDDLLDPLWLHLQTVVGTDNRLQLLDPEMASGTTPRRYYRIRWSE